MEGQTDRRKNISEGYYPCTVPYLYSEFHEAGLYTFYRSIGLWTEIANRRTVGQTDGKKNINPIIEN